MKKYNVSEIMKRAHEIRRANSYDGIPAVWGLCLTMSWDEAKNPLAAPIECATSAEDYTARAAYQVSTLNPSALLNWMTAAARTAARWEIRRAADPNTYAQSNETILWGLYEQGLNDIVQEGVCRLYELISDPARMEKIYNSTPDGMTPLPLSRLVSNAARAACAKWRRDAVKYAAARERIIDDGEGHEMGEISNAAAHDNTAADGISRADASAVWEKVEELGADYLAVFQLLVKGMTEKDISERLGMHKSSVHRKIERARSVARGVLVA